MSGSGPVDVAAEVEAVLFDWGGTLTPWHEIDFVAESRALAAAVRVDDTGTAWAGRVASGAGDATRASLAAAVQAVWGRSRDHHTSATVADIFVEAGLVHDESLLAAYRDFWEPHTLTDPDVPPLLRRLRADGLRVGVLSNTVWPRAWHEEVFRRDGVLDLVDGAVYTSEIAWT